jgi:DNA mismatch repair protein MutS2
LAETQQEVNLAGASIPAEAQAELLEPVSFDNLKPGAMLRLKGVSKLVRLRSFDGRQAEVELGRLHMKVAVAEILGVSPGPVVTKPTPTAVHAVADEVPDEINVIGCTVEEAREKVDKFLDQAALASKPRVRLIHGHGTGALRRGLAEFLTEHPLVERFSKEERERGGDAVTVVELRSNL